MSQRDFSDLEKNYNKYFRIVNELDSIDQITSLPEPALAHIILLNYTHGLYKADDNFWRDDFGSDKKKFKVILLKKVLFHLSLINEPLGIILFETLEHIDHSSKSKKEYFSLEEPDYRPFGIRCKVFSHYETQFYKKYDLNPADYIYLNWPNDSILGDLSTNVKLRSMNPLGEEGTKMSDLSFTDSDCENVPLHLLDEALLAKLWMYGASDDSLYGFLQEASNFDHLDYIDLIKKFAALNLSEPVEEKYRDVIDSRLKAKAYFPSESFSPGILTFAIDQLEHFRKASKNFPLHLVELVPTEEANLKSCLRSSLRVDADIILFPNQVELDDDTCEMIANAYLTGHNLAFSEPCQSQIDRINSFLERYKMEIKVYKLPAKPN